MRRNNNPRECENVKLSRLISRRKFVRDTDTVKCETPIFM